MQRQALPAQIGTTDMSFLGLGRVYAYDPLAAYAAGLPSFVLVKVLSPSFFARGDTSTPVRYAVFSVVLNLVLNIALMVPLKHLAPPAATSIAALANVSMLWWASVKAGYLKADDVLRRRSTRMAYASAVMAAVQVPVQLWLFHESAPHTLRLLALRLWLVERLRLLEWALLRKHPEPKNALETQRSYRLVPHK